MIPNTVTLSNYARVLKGQPVMRWTLNTIFVVGAGTVLCVLVSAMGGYYLARNRTRWGNVFYALVIFSMMIPRQAIIVPLFVTVVKISIPAILGAALPGAYFPIGIIFYKTYIESLPVELEEVARLDGASTLRILMSVYLPMATPVTGTVAILAGMGLLTDYIWQNLLFRKPEEMTLVVGILGSALKNLTVYTINPIGLRLAAGVLMFVPLFLIFAFAQKYFTEGLQTGSLR